MSSVEAPLHTTHCTLLYHWSTGILYAGMSVSQQSSSTEASKSNASQTETAPSTTAAVGLTHDAPGSSRPSGSSSQDTQDSDLGDYTSGIDPHKWVVNGKAQAFYWRFFRKSKEGITTKALCALCRQEVSSSPSGNLLSHLTHNHGKHPAYKLLKNEDDKRVVKEQKTKRPMSTFAMAGISVADRDQFFATYIVKDILTISTVESPNFRQMMRGMTGRPNLQFPSRKSLVAYIQKQASTVKDKIRELLHDVPVALTGDGWDSGSGSFYSLTAHIVDPGTDKLRRLTLACRKMEDRHTGEK